MQIFNVTYYFREFLGRDTIIPPVVENLVAIALDTHDAVREHARIFIFQ
jgi:hypothetical protein